LVEKRIRGLTVEILSDRREHQPMRIFMKVFMPIRIRRCDNKYEKAQIFEFYNTIAVVFAVSTAGYMGRKPVIRILCGSI
jgi:hypothetical protein